jgi:hypothetical protein
VFESGETVFLITAGHLTTNLAIPQSASTAIDARPAVARFLYDSAIAGFLPASSFFKPTRGLEPRTPSLRVAPDVLILALASHIWR